MDKIKIFKDEKTLLVTERLFNLVYRGIGYRVVQEQQQKLELLEDLTVKELKEIAKEKEIENYSDLKKADLITAIEGE